MAFAVFTVWWKFTNHADNGYFCLTLPINVAMKKRVTPQYSNLPSDIRPISYSASLPVYTPRKHYENQVKTKDSVEKNPTHHDY